MVGFLKKILGKKMVLSNEDMAPSDNQGFITTLEREFSVPIFEEFGEWIVERDEVYEIFSEGLGDRHPTYELLSIIGDMEIQRIGEYARKFCEDDRITDLHVRNGIKAALLHWGEGDKNA